MDSWIRIAHIHTDRLLDKTERAFKDYVAKNVYVCSCSLSSVPEYACFDLITSAIESVCKKRKFQNTNRIDESDMYLNHNSNNNTHSHFILVPLLLVSLLTSAMQHTVEYASTWIFQMNETNHAIDLCICTKCMNNHLSLYVHLMHREFVIRNSVRIGVAQ